MRAAARHPDVVVQADAAAPVAAAAAVPTGDVARRVPDPGADDLHFGDCLRPAGAADPVPVCRCCVAALQPGVSAGPPGCYHAGVVPAVWLVRLRGAQSGAGRGQNDPGQSRNLRVQALTQ